MKYNLSPRAQADIEDIWDYSVEHWGADQAEIYILQLRNALNVISRDPERGRSCDEVRAGYKKFAAGSHRIFYRLTDAGVSVVRILHRRRDFRSHL